MKDKRQVTNAGQRGAESMLTNRKQKSTSQGWTRFHIFARSKQWATRGDQPTAERDTAAHTPSTQRAAGRAKQQTARKTSRFLNSTSLPVKDVTNAQGIIWVDAVGGFLAVLEDTVRIGQALPDNRVELPIVGDISRQHAVIQRSGEDYLLMPHSPTKVSGKSIGGLTRLTDGDEIDLNDSVQLRFRKPHPLSNSARLDVLSHHRTLPPVDGILLIGQNLLLGKEPNHHIVCRDWDHSLVLQKQTSQSKAKPSKKSEPGGNLDSDRPLPGFRFQSAEPVQVNQNAAKQTGCIEWGERLTGENFALVLERL